MQRTVEKLVAWAFLITMGAGLWLAFDNAPFASEIVVYQGWCPTARSEAGTCPAGEQSANPVTFKAFPETQSVVYWYKNQAPSRMTKCAVRDAENWSCNEGEGYLSAMVDGRISERTGLASMFYQVPKYKWYWLWLHTSTS